MPDREMFAHYKGYSIAVSTTAMDGRSFGPTVATVRAEPGEHAEPLHRDVIQTTFSNDRDAYDAGFAAAHKWIDEQTNG